MITNILFNWIKPEKNYWNPLCQLNDVTDFTINSWGLKTDLSVSSTFYKYLLEIIKF